MKREGDSKFARSALERRDGEERLRSMDHGSECQIAEVRGFGEMEKLTRNAVVPVYEKGLLKGIWLSTSTRNRLVCP